MSTKIQQLQQRIQALQKQKATLTKALDAARKRAANLAKEAKNLNRQVTTLTSDLEKCEKRCPDLAPSDVLQGMYEACRVAALNCRTLHKPIGRAQRIIGDAIDKLGGGNTTRTLRKLRRSALRKARRKTAACDCAATRTRLQAIIADANTIAHVAKIQKDVQRVISLLEDAASSCSERSSASSGSYETWDVGSSSSE